MSWVVFSARGRRFFPDGGGGSRRGKESKEEMWLEEKRGEEAETYEEEEKPQIKVSGTNPQIQTQKNNQKPTSLII